MHPQSMVTRSYNRSRTGSSAHPGAPMNSAFTIKIYVPDGDPEGVRIIDKMNWTGRGIAFPRLKWQDVRSRPEFTLPGIYILVGFPTDDDLPTMYIGQADGVRNRIDAHAQSKDFWTWGIVFVSTSGGLNRGHITWLEYALIAQANRANRSLLDNGAMPQEPALSESEKADTQGFFNEIIHILPLVSLKAFDIPRPVATPGLELKTLEPSSAGMPTSNDTVVVPAQKDGFEKVFLGENCWRSIRIGGGMLTRIKYIAGYQTQPISAITHYAEVDRIEPFGEGGKYKLLFKGNAQAIGPIPFADAPQGTMQGSRYTTFEKLLRAKKLTDLF